MRVMGHGRVVDCVRRFDHMRHRIDAKSRDPEGEPKIDDPLDLFTHFGTGYVQIRFEVIELMVIILTGKIVIGPDGLFLVRKNSALVWISGRWRVRPDVIAAVARVPVVSRGVEPGMRGRGIRRCRRRSSPEMSTRPGGRRRRFCTSDLSERRAWWKPLLYVMPVRW